MSIGEYPDFAGFVIFVMGRSGGWFRKMRLVHNADQVVGTRSKKIFSGVSTMCLQLGSVTNQLDGVD